MNDALEVLRVLAGRLGRQPTYVELLRELGHDPAGMPVQGVNDPGYAAHPQHGSALLGDVPSDESLSAALQADELAEANPELVKAREEMVRRLLFGELLGQGQADPLRWLFGGSGGTPSPTFSLPTKSTARPSVNPPLSP